MAGRSVSPVSMASVGEPATTTGSLNVTLTAILAPALYARLALSDDADSADGSMVSMAMFLE